LGQKGDWVVMAAWPQQLCTRRRLPADAPAQQHAAAEADAFRGRLVFALEEIQALFGGAPAPRSGHYRLVGEISGPPGYRLPRLRREARRSA
jgi:hypothetical protein